MHPLIGRDSDNAGQSDALGACITQVRAGSVNVAVQNALGAIGSIPAFSPQLQCNLRARYDWRFNDYKTFVLVGMTHVGYMYNQPSTFQLGATAWPDSDHHLAALSAAGYTTFDASLGVAQGRPGTC